MLLEGNLRGVQHLGIPVFDLDRVESWYVEKLGFSTLNEASLPVPEGEIKVAFLEKEDLVLEFYQLAGEALDEIGSRGHGHIDHFALDVLDIESALNEAFDAGISLEQSTPEGPLDIPFFWSKGVKYAFLEGPGGEKVEFNQRLDLSPDRRVNNLNGWSHLGIPVTDIDSSRDFYGQFGFEEVMYAEIPVEDQAVKASMMELNGFILEFYQLLGDDLEEIRGRSDGHIDHIAMDVVDADQAFEEIAQAGLKTLEDEPVFLPFWEDGVKFFNIRGLDGEKVEFNQIIKPSSAV
jgi:lactoylglutathione lyase